MAISTIAEQIRERVSMHDVFERYGFETNRGGFIVCPFHNERTPSLKSFADDRKFKCFGCGASGSVIDFVMKLYGINFQQAILRMDQDFSLGLINGYKPPSLRERREQAARRLEQKRAEQEAHDYLNALTAFRRLLWNVYLEQRPSSADEPLKSGFVYAIHHLDEIDAEISELSLKERR